MKKIYALLLIAPLLLTSCASGYDTISTNGLAYVSKSSNEELTLEYKYEILDKKYGKKQDKKNVKILNAKITNNTDKPIVVGPDTALLYSGGSEIQLIEPEIAFKEIKQSAASYLFYLLLTPLNFYTTSNGEQTSSTPIGLILGPGLAGANMIAAGSANKKLQSDLMDKSLLGTSIEPGESKTGLLTFYSNGFESLKLELK